MNALDNYEIIGRFCVRKAMYDTFNDYLTEIETLIEAGLPIPAKTAKVFFELLEQDEKIINNEKKKHGDVNLEKVIAYFKKYKGYLFSGQHKEQRKTLTALNIFYRAEIEDLEFDVPHSFELMITSCIYSYNLFKDFLNLDRDGAILYFFDIIDKYCEKYNIMQANPITLYTSYRKRVIAAYLTMIVAELPLWDYENKVVSVSTGRNEKGTKSVFTHFKNKDLFQATRNAFKD